MDSKLKKLTKENGTYLGQKWTKLSWFDYRSP